MLFTITPSADQDDRICLYLSSEAALAAASYDQKVVGVSVHYDGLLHRLLPVGGGDPAWSTPAEYHDDGVIVACGPIPKPLFAG